jgi:hypothetical protein
MGKTTPNTAFFCCGWKAMRHYINMLTPNTAGFHPAIIVDDANEFDNNL